MLKVAIIFFSSLLICIDSESQTVNKTDSGKPYKIGMFVPLYLDSVFKGGNYRYGKKFPRFTLQGLEFVQGAELALDSFPSKEQLNELFIYDSKSSNLKIDSLIYYHRLDSLDLLIGLVKDEELISLAEFAKQRQIPFLSVTYPNDGGIKNNPFYLILNPTLKTHCQSIFSLLLQNHSNDNILLIKKTGIQEDRVQDYFKSINFQDSIPLLKINYVTQDSNYHLIENYLDSTRRNIVIAASLDEEFAQNIVLAIKNKSEKFKVDLIGMPNWGSFSSFGKSIKNGLRDFPFYYTAPFFNEKNDSISKVIQNNYMKKYKGYPGEFAYKGFEVMNAFSGIMKKSVSTDDLISMAKSGYYSQFNFLPFYKDAQKMEPDYYENRHLFFLKKLNGKTTKSDF